MQFVRTVGLVAIVALTGCMTKPVSMAQSIRVPAERQFLHREAVTPGGEIVVIRDVGMSGGGCAAAITVGGKDAAHLETGERVSLFLPAGEHLVGVLPTGRGLCSMGAERVRRETSVRLADGEEKRFRLSINPNAGPSLDPISF